MNLRLTLAAAAVAASSGIASAQPVRVFVASKEGDVLPGTGGLTCTSLNDPYTNSLGKIGFTGNSSGGNFVWYDTGVIWLNSNSISPVLAGAEGTMGVSDAGGFLYSPAADSQDAVWTQAGFLLADETFIPSLGLFSVFNSRPRMVANGQCFWVGGTSALMGGSTTQRHFFRVTDPAAPVFDALISGGGVHAGLTVTAQGVEFGYDVSDNGAHSIHNLSSTEVAATNSYMYLRSTDSVAAREGFDVPGFPGELWVVFRIPGINNFGRWVVAGDTNAAAASDEIVVYNNSVLLREGTVVSGTTLTGATNALSINNRSRVAVIFNGTPEILVAGYADTFGNVHKVLQVGDEVDVDGDSVSDFTVANFFASNTAAPGLDIADDGMIWVSVDLTPIGGGANVEAVVGVRDICLADFDENGTRNVADIFAMLAAWFPNLAHADWNLDGLWTISDIFAFIATWFAGC